MKINPQENIPLSAAKAKQQELLEDSFDEIQMFPVDQYGNEWIGYGCKRISSKPLSE